MMLLSQEDFSHVVEHTPLISIDLIVKNSKGEVLLGKRVNEPASGYWFVPGGRIFKDETLHDAFLRTTNSELSLSLEQSQAKFYGLYEHFYHNNVFTNNFSTHYIVMAHEIETETIPSINHQHSEYQWFTIKNLLEDESVHGYTKDYFRKIEGEKLNVK